MSNPDGSPGAFAFRQTFEVVEPTWRTFSQHYLLYAASGAFQLEVEDAQWLLPPQRAAWIAAGVPTRVSARAPVLCSSVLYEPRCIAPPVANCRVFAVSALAREMIVYAMRWGRERDPHDAAANRFFLSLAAVCTELAATPDQFWLPLAHSEELRRALAYTLEHLADGVGFGDVAQVAGTSERTLARRCADELAMTWRQYVRRARMIRAMELLADPTIKVLEVIYATGFESVSAFNSAFRSFSGETPSHYRQRVLPR